MFTKDIFFSVIGVNVRMALKDQDVRTPKSASMEIHGLGLNLSEQVNSSSKFLFRTV